MTNTKNAEVILQVLINYCVVCTKYQNVNQRYSMIHHDAILQTYCSMEVNL